MTWKTRAVVGTTKFVIDFFDRQPCFIVRSVGVFLLSNGFHCRWGLVCHGLELQCCTTSAPGSEEWTKGTFPVGFLLIWTVGLIALKPSRFYWSHSVLWIIEAQGNHSPLSIKECPCDLKGKMSELYFFFKCCPQVNIMAPLRRDWLRAPHAQFSATQRLKYGSRFQLSLHRLSWRKKDPGVEVFLSVAVANTTKRRCLIVLTDFWSMHQLGGSYKVGSSEIPLE